MNFDFLDLLNIRIAIHERISYYKKEISRLENKEIFEGSYYNMIVNDLEQHKSLYDKIDYYIKNFDDIKWR